MCMKYLILYIKKAKRYAVVVRIRTRRCYFRAVKRMLVQELLVTKAKISVWLSYSPNRDLEVYRPDRFLKACQDYH